MSKKVYLIVASVRSGRIGRQIAEWVLENLPSPSLFQTELLDLNDWPLPLGDEPAIPATGVYAHEHTRAWSRKIAAGDGFIFVTPQYNWGYPAALKNALDHLFKEWNGKPAAIVSYGHHGGGKAAAQLRQVLDGLRMRSAATMPAITFLPERLNAEGQFDAPAKDFAAYAKTIAQAAEELAMLLTPPT